ncbi:type II toxin-antitoxin system RelE family toxin [Nostoc sp. WHI]|uniref:type II toxin-antitoxin system RelE family toxin n=1 Tax=Nostoc sp. WHI TaxID=2650611 RepID=UPI0018C65915|nr:type II toxin-antitoxin system RelE/ParE family toxin [Nostoc sp. WHI]MBG1267579.1 type II toxin-antitoxin system RelE/ParE family toxin [Nostoc sp. WHI]
MTYQIEISNRAVKQLKKLSADIRDRVNEKILELADNPRPSGVVKLENTDNKYRIRIGNYRILYEIQDDVLIVKVVRVGHRRDVYRDE